MSRRILPLPTGPLDSSRWTRLLAAVCVAAFLLLPSVSSGGPNAGGSLIIAISEGTAFTHGVNFCGTSTAGTCEDAVVSGGLPGETVVAHVLAAFPPGSSPQVRGVVFGIDYDPSLHVENYRPCEQSLEIPTANWPDAESGTALVWSEVLTAELLEVYWFGLYYDGAEPAEFRFIVNPAQPLDGLTFAGPAADSELDPVAATGTLGFGQPGVLPCPAETEQACCLPDGQCVIQLPSDCSNAGGTYLGIGVACDPDPCASLGACCLGDGTCSPLSEPACFDLGGTFQGEGTTCSPSPCPAPEAACCLPLAGCVLATESECASLDGLFLFGETCLGESCPEPCTPTVAAPSPSPARVGGETGPNVGGVLVLHSAPALAFSSAGEPDCSTVAIPACDDVTTETELPDPVTLYALAYFPLSTSPDVKTIGFAVEYSTCLEIVDWSRCGDVEAPSPGWPASGTYTGTGWLERIHDRTIAVYRFVVEGYTGGAGTMSLTGSGVPGQISGPFFVTNDFVDFGTFGFSTPGHAPCPAEPGACCYEDGTCAVLPPNECDSSGGSFAGSDVACEGACVVTPTHTTTWGRIKADSR